MNAVLQEVDNIIERVVVPRWNSSERIPYQSLRALVLTFMLGRTHEQAGEILGISSSGVENSLNRLYRRLPGLRARVASYDPHRLGGAATPFRLDMDALDEREIVRVF
jgi:hypothetical protein